MDECKSDYASNTLNKWLKKQVPDGCVIHSFRHSMRDRLRLSVVLQKSSTKLGVGKPLELGRAIGDGFSLENLEAWLIKIRTSQNGLYKALFKSFILEAIIIIFLLFTAPFWVPVAILILGTVLRIGFVLLINGVLLLVVSQVFFSH